MEQEIKEFTEEKVCKVHCKTPMCLTPCGYVHFFLEGMNLHGWHNITQHPEDMPIENNGKFKRYYIMMQGCADRAAYFKDGGFVNILDNCRIRTNRIIAWCEMPPFYINEENYDRD